MFRCNVSSGIDAAKALISPLMAFVGGVSVRYRTFIMEVTCGKRRGRGGDDDDPRWILTANYSPPPPPLNGLEDDINAFSSKWGGYRYRYISPPPHTCLGKYTSICLNHLHIWLFCCFFFSYCWLIYFLFPRPINRTAVLRKQAFLFLFCGNLKGIALRYLFAIDKSYARFHYGLGKT